MKKYFKSTNKKDLVKEFKQLAKQLHPDNGGDAESFKEMQAEFDKLLKTLPETENAQQGTERKAADIPQEMAEVIKKVAHLDGIEIEICGSWVWVSGNTYPVKNAIKAAGFKFSSGKKAWYWHNENYQRKSRKKYSMDDIRIMHGSFAVEKEKVYAIA